MLLRLIARLPRMWEWIVVAALLACLIAYIAPHQLPVTLYKLSLITAGAVLGYWIDRSLFPFERPGRFNGPDLELAASQVRRALIVAACIVGTGLGA